MSDEDKNQIYLPLPPYGRWPDGRPITQLEASAKQMDDWASRFGFSGHVRMGIAKPYSEPEKWIGVNIGQGDPLPPTPRPLQISASESTPEPTPIREAQPARQSWFRRLLNFFKGGR